MKMLILACALFCFINLLHFPLISARIYKDPDAFRNTVQLIESRGFLAETHYVTTEDGYILTVHRIINPYNQRPDKRVIILQHGVMSSGTHFIINSPGGDVNSKDTGDICDDGYNLESIGKNIGFELSKIGFDVWLTNTRGSGLSINHTTLSTRSKRFWEFSFDEMIEFDLAAYIDYILDFTGQKTVSYVGHSEGGLTAIGLQATKPQYNQLLKPFIAMAPGYSFENTRMWGYIQRILPYWLTKVQIAVGGPTLPTPRFAAITKYLCNTPLTAILCEVLSSFGFGYNFEQGNRSRVHVYLSSPSQTSRWNMAHYAQLMRGGKKHVYKLDFGFSKNYLKYGHARPPRYKTEKITNKYIALMYAANDLIISVESMKTLKRQLKVPVFEDYLVPKKKWNHMDFLFAKDVDVYVNRKIVEILKRALCEG